MSRAQDGTCISIRDPALKSQRLTRPATLVAALLLTACATTPLSQPITETLQPALIPLDVGYPLSTERLRTTDPALFLGNLDARIDTHRQFLARTESAAHRAALAGALNQRFRILGRLKDGEDALANLQRARELDPGRADAQLAYASTLSAFHRFDEAEQALARARQLNANAGALARIERDLNVAQGRYDLLAEDFAHSREPVADFYELAHRADLRVLQGDLDGATHWYHAAQDLYADVDPLPLAWLYAQQGIALLRHGLFAEAQPFFAAAHERLPKFALATEHLAECEFRLGHLERARALYHEVIAQTANPEFIAALAKVEQAAGDLKLAQSLRAQAETGYADLLARHRAAYAQHAAEFLLSIDQPEKALPLARENLALRKDIGSWILLARSSDAVGELSAACNANTAARALNLKPPELAQLDDLALRCAARSVTD
jgi:thioredoxin-like negative regulator of GroEL